MFTRIFWKATLERSLKTFAQVEVGFLTGSGLGILNVDWATTLSIAGLAAIASVLTSIATAAATDGNPSLGNAEKLSPVG